MRSKAKMEVVAWRDSGARNASKSTAGGRHALSPGVIGLVGTLLLHTLALQSVLLGSRAHKIRLPQVQEPGAALVKSDNVPAETLILIDLPRIVKSDQDIPEELASAGAARRDTLVRLISPDPLPRLDPGTLALNEDKDSEAAVDSGDGAERARLFGIYTGQTWARIERIWRRPRTPVSEGSDLSSTTGLDESFRCQVRIVQDRKGNVQEILLPSCNGTAAWQRSLVLAIQQSSPLPAPPSPTVFSNALTLTFTGDAYAPGRNEDEYEIAPLKTAQAVLPSAGPGSAVPASVPSAPMSLRPTLRLTTAPSPEP
jgi:hypothetical protein